MQIRSRARIITGLFFIAAGMNHFRRPRMYRAIMPDYLPWHRSLVAFSGIAELALGGAVLVPRVQRRAGWALIALLAAVFPANLHMAQHSARYPRIPAWLLWLRLPLQPLLMAWVWWCTQTED